MYQNYGFPYSMPTATQPYGVPIFPQAPTAPQPTAPQPTPSANPLTNKIYVTGIDGAAVVGANQTVTVTTDGTQSVAVSFPAVVRVNACNTSALSITSSAAITVTNAALKVIED